MVVGKGNSFKETLDLSRLEYGGESKHFELEQTVTQFIKDSHKKLIIELTLNVSVQAVPCILYLKSVTVMKYVGLYQHSRPVLAYMTVQIIC